MLPAQILGWVFLIGPMLVLFATMFAAIVTTDGWSVAVRLLGITAIFIGTIFFGVYLLSRAGV